MVKSLLLPLLAACAALAQSPTDLFRKAPPDVDQALRARISEFYQLHVEGKFRQAEKLVAEDTKDFFYAANKPKYLSFEVKDIQYSDDFKRAKATIVCDMYVQVLGFMNKPLKVPHASTWKIESDGNWYWYVDQEAMKDSPFGRMKTDPNAARASLPTSLQQLAGGMGTGVQADKTDIQLDGAHASSGTVTVANGMPGMITLTLLHGAAVPGLEIHLDPQVAAGAKGTLTASWKPGSPVPANPVQVRIKVEQTNQEFPVSISFQK